MTLFVWWRSLDVGRDERRTNSGPAVPYAEPAASLMASASLPASANVPPWSNAPKPRPRSAGMSDRRTSLAGARLAPSVLADLRLDRKLAARQDQHAPALRLAQRTVASRSRLARSVRQLHRCSRQRHAPRRRQARQERGTYRSRSPPRPQGR